MLKEFKEFAMRDGSPFYPDGEVLWRYAEDIGYLAQKSLQGRRLQLRDVINVGKGHGHVFRYGELGRG